MAEILKRRHDLVSFRVALDAAGPEPRVRCALEVTSGHVLRTEAEWVCVPQELGLPERVERGQARGGSIPLRLPDRLLEELRRGVFAAGAPTALWLHLVKPYAHLGVAPWDRVLTEALNLPVLRLPDFLAPPAKESPRTLDVALCVSQPRAKSSFDARSFAASFVNDVATGVPRGRVSVHLFTDAEQYREIRAAVGSDHPVRFPAASGQALLWLHDPAQAARYAEPRAAAVVNDLPGRIDNPWLLWMRDTLRGRCLDVVHFACHGYYALDRGAVALAASPVHNDDEGWARFVGAAELDTFLTQSGAWAAAFSSPPGNFSDAGLRHLADDLAQRKPFATLYHDLAHDQACRDLALAYRFLYDPRPAEPEPMACVSIYCQPCRITGEMPGPAPQAKEASPQPSDVLSQGALDALESAAKKVRDLAEKRVDDTPREGFGGPRESGGSGGGRYGRGGSDRSGKGGYDAWLAGLTGASYGSGGGGDELGLDESGGGGGYDGTVHGGEGADGGDGADAGLAGASGGEPEAPPQSGGEPEAPPQAGGEPEAPPQSGGEPEAAAPAPAVAPASSATAAEATLEEVFRTADAVPTWLAAAQRFVEGHAWQVRQWEQGSAPAAPEQQAELEVTRRTLAQIQEVLAKHAVASRAGGDA